jgi:predicted RNA-binding protein with PUA-like domain
MASWEQLTAEGVTTWHGGQSSASRMTIRMIQEGDEALILNGDPRRALVGIARVVRAAYPAPTPDEPSRLAIELQPIARIAPVIMLSRLRTDSQLHDCAMLRIPTPELVRLSSDQRRILRRLGVA